MNANQNLIDGKTIIAAGTAINEVEAKYGKVTKQYIAYMQTLKLPLLKVIATNADMKAETQKTLDALSHAIEYADGDGTARSKYLLASKQAVALTKKRAKVR